MEHKKWPSSQVGQVDAASLRSSKWVQHHSCVVAVASHLFPASKRKKQKKKRGKKKRPTGPHWPLSTQIGHGLPCIACARSRGPDRSLCSKKTSITSVYAVNVHCVKNATFTRLPVRSNRITKRSRKSAWFLQIDFGSRHDVAGARSGRPDMLRSHDLMRKNSNIAVGHVQVFEHKVYKGQKDALTPVQHLHLSIAGHGNSSTMSKSKHH